MVRPRDPAPELGPRRERGRAVHLQQPHAQATVHEQVQAQELEASRPPPVVPRRPRLFPAPIAPIAPSRQRTQRGSRAPPNAFPHALVARGSELGVELGRQRVERPVALKVRVGVPRHAAVGTPFGTPFVRPRRRRRVVGEVHGERRRIARVPRRRREPDQAVAVHVRPRGAVVRVPPREQRVRAQVDLAAVRAGAGHERQRISNVALRDPTRRVVLRTSAIAPVGGSRPLQRLAGGARDDRAASFAADGSLDDPPGAALVAVIVVGGGGGKLVRLRGQHEGSRRDGVALGVSPQHHRERMLVRDRGGPREVVDERVGR